MGVKQTRRGWMVGAYPLPDIGMKPGERPNPDVSVCDGI